MTGSNFKTSKRLLFALCSAILLLTVIFTAPRILWNTTPTSSTYFTPVEVFPMPKTLECPQVTPEQKYDPEREYLVNFIDDTQKEEVILTLPTPRIILFWTKYYGGSPHINIHNSMAHFTNCSRDFGFHCILTDDRSMLNYSAAVVFHELDLNRTDIPSRHIESQMWVYLHGDTLLYYRSPWLGSFIDFFNWTMTYRTDSDIPDPYGRTVKLSQPSQSVEDHRIKVMSALGQKKKLVAWLVSHCNVNSQRDQIARDMQKFIPVDIFGKCGNLTCEGNRMTTSNCFEHIATNYKFYLAFENSLCVDYITEKAFHALQYYTVPIVYGGANYSAMLPPNSYIDILQFEEMQDLTDYLVKLDKDDVAFSKYFEWKRHYQVLEDVGSGWCTLCRKISHSVQRRSYANINDFQNSRGLVRTRKAPSWMKSYLNESSSKHVNACNLFTFS